MNTPSAPALTFGMMWSGNLPRDASEMDVIRRSGATLYRMSIDMNTTTGGTDWSFYDPIFTSAWQSGITIVPVVHAGSRFLGPNDVRWPSWTPWVKAVVKRYGPGGDFWAGKSNPLPVTTWEIWNEPNLPENNPQLTRTQCQNGGWPIFNDGNGNFNNCVQPDKYGQFLVSTSSTIHAQSSPVSVLFGGLAFPYGDNFNHFLTPAYTVPNLYSSYTGLDIHPYDFDSSHTNGDKVIDRVITNITGVRSLLNTLQWGPSRSLWIGELGWPLNDYGNKNFPQVKDEVEQERLLTQSFDWIKSQAVAKNIQALFWYNVRDGFVQSWDHSSGLRRDDGGFRLSWFAYQTATGAPPLDSSASAAVQYGTAFNLYVRGANGNLYQKWCCSEPQGWSSWWDMGSPPGGGIIFGPTAVDTGTAFNVYVVGANGNLYQKWCCSEPQGWSSWWDMGSPPGGGIISSPVAANTGSATNVYVRGVNGNLYQKACCFGSQGWTSWWDMGKP